MNDESASSKGTECQADWLTGGGEMGKLIRSMDWSDSPLGPIDSWPQSLRTTVSLCLASNFPISIAWGPKHVQIYNDGYWPICGGKHPRSMGQDFSECWASAMPVIGDAFERALAGETSYLENQRMFLDRNGYLEETFFTFSFSPIRDESGGVGGLFHPVTETTSKMLSERRTRALRDLAARAGNAQSLDESFAVAAGTLAEHELDLPFVLIYEIDGREKQAHLVESVGLPAGAAASPGIIQLQEQAGHTWPLDEVVATGTTMQVDGLEQRFGRISCGPYPESPKSAILLPITPPGSESPLAVLVTGVSSRLPFNEMYRSFCDLLASAVTTAVANARAYEEERRRAEALAELDRAKTNFFSNVSHEFRTPLTLMLGPLEDALSDPGNPLSPAQEERLQVAHRNSLRLLKLVNSLLDFSRIEAGRIQAVYEPTDLSAFTAELASSFRSACGKAGLTLNVDCPPLPEAVFVDRDMWEKIVLNLVSNAFKFTLEGEIEVAMRTAGRHVELVVRDTGTGIPSEEMPKLFERFHRVEGTRGRTQEGSGIGLALVQELVRLHGGNVRAESESGRGTTFIVRIPFGRDHLAAERIGAECPLASTSLGTAPFVEEALRWIPGTEIDRPVYGDATQPPESRRRDPLKQTDQYERARILWADDNADMRDYVCRLLSRDYEVTAVEDGIAALNAARMQSHDLVLTDIMMPGLDGFGLLRELRSEERTRDLPVILLSARAGEEARVEGMEAGADDYLVKPFSARELLARVGAHLQMARLRRDSARAVQESEERFRAFVMASSDAVYRMSADWSEMHDLQGQEFIADTREPSQSWLDKYIHPDDQQHVMKMIRKAIRRRSVFEMEHRVLRVDGSLGWTYSRAVPLLDANGEIREWIGAASDVTRRKQTEESLQQLAAELSEANRRKDEFLATLAHELRNPLAPIRTGLEFMKLAADDPAQVEEAREIMERQAQQMVRLVDDLLDVSRITCGKLELRKCRVELGDVVQSAVEASRPFINEAGHKLTVSVPEQPILLNADPHRLAQVLSNLLNNAAKYTSGGGGIELKAARQGTDVVISVTDTGLGIPVDRLENIFEMFSQIDRPMERNSTGLGIGLTLVKSLVEMHGGSVEVFSEGEGRGSEFRVRIPTAENRSATERLSATCEEGLRVDRKRRVLVVDDNKAAAEMLARVVRMLGHDVRTADDGQQAIATAAEFLPDVIVMDLGMPKMDGYEAARHIRQQDWGANIVLIALTGWGQEEDRLKTRDAGFDHHLVKPAEPSELQRLLKVPAQRSSSD